MLAVIGGTGLSQMNGFEPAGQERVATPFCKGKIEIDLLQRNGCKLAFLHRHGKKHENPPHKINYQANIWALHKLGVDKIIAVNAVGGIHKNLGPGCLAVQCKSLITPMGAVPLTLKKTSRRLCILILPTHLLKRCDPHCSIVQT